MIFVVVFSVFYRFRVILAISIIMSIVMGVVFDSVKKSAENDIDIEIRKMGRNNVSKDDETSASKKIRRCRLTIRIFSISRWAVLAWTIAIIIAFICTVANELGMLAGVFS